MKNKKPKTQSSGPAKYYDNFGRLCCDADNLGMPYVSVSESCNTLNVDVPDSMGFETHEAIKRIQKNVGGSTTDFVADRLGYKSTIELCKALAAEQTDAVALAIYNMEAYGQGIIIGDQTGIGKGRQAAAIIRYASVQGKVPIFLTEKPNLFSDIYRDLAAIGSADLVPFIVNGKESKTDVKDEDGKVIYQALEQKQQNEIFESKKLPKKYDYILATYSQFNSAEKKPMKPSFLYNMAENNILIFDEAHNASGSSQTGAFLKDVVSRSAGVLFLSATFAKRPDNMPIYALKTAISEANMSADDLTESIVRGGVALQEVLASQLVREAQMLRRERTYEGIEVNYLTLTDLEVKHKKIADMITEVMREIIGFQEMYIARAVAELDKIVAAKNASVEQRKGTAAAGVDNQPYFSKVFNVINQMLFSIKADAVADRAIMRLKQGKKPVIAFASTMESFLDDLGIAAGGTVDADYAMVLEKGLDSVLKITIRNAAGDPTYEMIKPHEVGADCQADYNRIKKQIKEISSGISISPIDIIKQKIEAAGFTVAEVTGRKTEVQINPKTMMGVVMPRKKINTNDAFRMFNNNEVDVLMINQAGSTGASAHAIPTKTVPADRVQQRVMIVLQPELDINREVQKRGRINRTGQIIKPIYDYVSSAIPAEQRLMMMLQRKLKSLDANTTSNQKSSSAILSVPDFLNKIGDDVVTDYLIENVEMNKAIGDPLGLLKSSNDGEKSEPETKEDAASRVSGRVAILKTDQQKKFYDEIILRYNDQVEYLKQIGEYDLEIEILDLKTVTKKKDVVIVGKGGRSQFGTNSYLETVEANVLKKPYSKSEVEKIIRETLKGKSPAQIQQTELADFEAFTSEKLKADIRKVNDFYNEEIKNIPNEKIIKSIKDSAARQTAIRERTKELEEGREAEILMEEKISRNRFDHLSTFLNYFWTGRGINFPDKSYDEGEIITPGVCLGVIIDKKRANPYAPSAMKFRFALTDSKKYITLVASGKQGATLNNIVTSSIRLTENESDSILKDWIRLCANSNVNRKTRFIVTSNILQAFSEYKGSLVSYTTMKGETLKGILMPDNWTTKNKKENFVTLPIIQALNMIVKLSNGSTVNTTNHISIRKNYDDTYMVLVPASRKQGGEIYLDADLIKITVGKNFNKTSGFMKAVIETKHIKEFVKILQDKFNVAVQIHANTIDLNEIEAAAGERAPEEVHLKLNHKIKPAKESKLDLLELEAEALELELELLTL